MEEYVFQGRIAISHPRLVGEGENTFNQNSISGVLISFTDMPLLSDALDWENIQCEVIIRPLKRLGVAKIKNMRLDHAVEALADDSKWEVPRRYYKAIDEDDDIYTVEEWNYAVNDGSFTNEDGSGYWVKDGLRSKDEVFSTYQEDATHVVWFNK